MPDSKKLVWDVEGSRFYTTGVDKVALYLKSISAAGYEPGVAWSGVSSIEESPSGAESTAIYADNIKYLDLTSKEEFGCSITAYQSPKEFDACDGTASPDGLPFLRIAQQARRRFGLVYRTNIGNDTLGNDFAYEYHICYSLKASVSSKSRNTINDSPEATELSWECTSTDVNITGFKPTAHIAIKVVGDQYTGTDEEAAAAGFLSGEKKTLLENTLFGTDDDDPTLPSPDELIALLSSDDTPDTPDEPEPVVTYTQVSPVGNENPSALGWYEGEDGHQVPSQDTEVNNEKTYWTVNTTSETTPAAGEG